VPYLREKDLPEPREYQILILSKLNWKQDDVATACDVSRATVVRTLKKWDEYALTLPELKIAQKRLETMIPQAITVFERNLNSKRADVAFKAAVAVLTNFGVLLDRKLALDDTDEQPTSRLVASVQRILAEHAAGKTGGTDKTNDSSPAPKDDGTPVGLEADTTDRSEPA
jgi:hypothetical protein